ncbi:hypothetical protein DFA_01713 [Cavenderia fasciculata]|uniref:Uncharacterized protein n=1 Tax=Cavenderia fasciculata TaxID=261658 RepID=F4PUB2_CACFS|nr:uncharacterized protein DFA_01713 [Cavenderia fasciculata]EGG21827.1 hypothetical protein DFA_01713 [Cavenderia fasciculata]|eukprot:XP_004359677.1 hypothetical protein DFA_01713 [Cavenderia fasciculata]
MDMNDKGTKKLSLSTEFINGSTLVNNGNNNDTAEKDNV